jgi:hypothetical protein
MTVEIGDIAPALLLDLRTCKKHQYDILKDNYSKAKRNNIKEITWMGHNLPLQFGNYLIEFLSPRFNDMK